MKKLINKIKDIVPEMVEGIVASEPEKLEKVKNYNVICNKKFNKNKVAIISGGGSGHEPAHGGFVGNGMLAGAVAGPIFTSPTPDMVKSAIDHLDSKKGTLLIIKNYTGDMINFQMSAEIARLEGKNIEFVKVADDISLIHSKSKVGMRGIAGTTFVHKIAGAKAESGASLKEVKLIAEKAIKNVATIGVALDACTVPAVGKKGFQLKEDEVEMGLGIHGEPGVKREILKPVDYFVTEMMNQIINFLKLKSKDSVGVLINGLGATPIMELFIANRKVCEILNKKKIKISKCRVGNYVTAIDMEGFSISVIKLDNELEKLLLAPCDTLAYKA